METHQGRAIWIKLKHSLKALPNPKTQVMADVDDDQKGHFGGGRLPVRSMTASATEQASVVATQPTATKLCSGLGLTTLTS